MKYGLKLIPSLHTHTENLAGKQFPLLAEHETAR